LSLLQLEKPNLRRCEWGLKIEQAFIGKKL